jgi:hypothetical protein
VQAALPTPSALADVRFAKRRGSSRRAILSAKRGHVGLQRQGAADAAPPPGRGLRQLLVLAVTVVVLVLVLIGAVRALGRGRRARSDCVAVA